MTDYEQLVKALRCETSNGGDCWEKKCQYLVCGSYAYCNSKRIMSDAAAAIEALQAQLPKRGKWLIHSTGGSMATKKCPFCGSESWQSKEYAKVPKYCENCGAHLPTFDIVDWIHYLHAKTEVQE